MQSYLYITVLFTACRRKHELARTNKTPPYTAKDRMIKILVYEGSLVRGGLCHMWRYHMIERAYTKALLHTGGSAINTWGSCDGNAYI
jgi:hypothetical protein